MEIRIGDLMQHSVDWHVHSNPHASGKKNLDAIEAAEGAKKAGMKGIALKCNFFPTSGTAYLVSRVVKGINIYGGIVLNSTIGGINASAVSKAISYGEGKPGEFLKIVWLPTFSAPGDVLFHKRRPEEIVNVIRDGRVVPEMQNVLEMIAEHNLILSTGHLSEMEVLPVLELAREVGVRKIVIDHPSAIIPNISEDGQKRMADMGALIEFCYVNTTKYYREKYKHSISILDMVRRMKSIGLDQCILSTDMGADPGVNPPPSDGFRLFLEELMRNGLSETDMDVLVRQNTSKLLGSG